MSKPFVILGGGFWRRGSKGWKWAKKNLAPHKPRPKRHTVFMYDDVNPSLIPKDAEAVAGYVGGRWPTFPQLEKDFPRAKKLSIAVSAAEDAMCLDVEPGDAEPSQAPDWVRRQLKLGNGVKTAWRVKPIPVLYTNASHGQALIDVCTATGLRYGVDYLWWSAHYDPALGKHICSSKCGFGIRRTAHATQFTDAALGRNLDESICKPGFFA